MISNERFDKVPGRVDTNPDKEKRRAMNNHQNIYPIYCEVALSNRLKRLSDKLAEKDLMFKFDGNHYAVFMLDIFDRSQITDYTLTLEQVEDFAENV